MLSSVSPVITGAEAASPQPTRPLSASILTSTLSARRTSSPAMMTGLSIGRLTAIGSIDLMCTGNPTNCHSGRRAAAVRNPGSCAEFAAGFRVRPLLRAPRNDVSLQLLDARLIDDVLE